MVKPADCKTDQVYVIFRLTQKSIILLKESEIFKTIVRL